MRSRSVGDRPQQLQGIDDEHDENLCCNCLGQRSNSGGHLFRIDAKSTCVHGGVHFVLY